MTELMKTQSLWSSTSSLLTWRALQEDIDVDVAIVGGGITGLTAALLLAESGKRVALVEARRLNSGVSARSTVHLTEAVDTRYWKIEDTFGEDAAKLVAQSSRAAIERVATLVEKFAIPCDFLRRPGYLFTEEKSGIEELRKEAGALERAGLRVSMHDAAPLPFATKAAIAFPNQAQMHIGRYLGSLASAAEKLGASIYEQSRVIHIEDGEPCAVHLEHGPTIRAGKVFVATHAPLNLVFLQTKIHAYRSYVMAFARPDAAIADGLFWDTADPYHYFSNFTVDGTPYFIVGGEDHKTGTTTDTDAHFDALHSWVRAHLPFGEPTFRWSAQVEEPVDGLPYIGRNSLADHVYVATGFSGNGITFGTVAAEIVTDLVNGKDNPWAELFAATRVKAGSAGEYVRENIDFPVHLVSDRLHPPDAKSFDDIAPGEGKTIRSGGERLAAHRDAQGKLHVVSSVCTHLGCIVKWNGAERTWDCPCHGSRFQVDGTVLEGPATRGLAKKEIR